MPFYGLPVQSHNVETLIQLDRFSNHIPFPHYTRVHMATHIDWGNAYPVNGKKGFGSRWFADLLLA